MPASPAPSQSTWPNTLRCFAAGLAHSLLLFLAFAPVGWWPCALIAMLPLVWLGAGRGVLRWREYLAVFVGVYVYWAFTEWWIFEIAGPGYPCLAAIESVWAVLFVWLLARTVRRWPRLPLVVIVPLLWTGIELLRGELFADGYAWSLIAYPLIDAPVLSAAAVAIGVYGIGFLTALLAGVFGDALFASPRRRGASLAGLGVWAVVTVAGPMIPHGAESGALRVAVLQTNVPQSNKIGWTVEQELEDYERFERLTRSAAGAGPGLIVWPETMLPGMTLEPAAMAELTQRGLVLRVPGRAAVPASYFADRVLALSRDVGVPMLVGEDAIEGLKVTQVGGGYDIGQERRYNSVYLLRGGTLDKVRYDKVCLTPFGETMPYISAWPWLQQKMLDVSARGMKFDLNKGTGHKVFDIPVAGGKTVRAVTPICFEVTVGPHCRRLVYGGNGERRADVIVNLTNDGWFGSFDVARWQILQIARWRCLELGTPMVRAANTGVSTLIDSRGRVLRSGVDDAPAGSGGARVEGVLSGAVGLTPEPTIFGRVGDVLPWTALFASLVLSVSTFVPGAKSRAAAGAAPTRGAPSSGAQPAKDTSR